MLLLIGFVILLLNCAYNSQVVASSSSSSSSSSLSSSDKILCDQSGQRRIDQVSSRLFVFGDTRKFPTNQQENTIFCRDGRRMEKQIKDYTKRCLNGLGKTFVSATILNIGKVNKMYCTNNIKKNELINSGECGNQNRDATIKCVKDLVNGIISGKYVNSTMKLPIICCNYYKWKTCIIKAYKSVGPPKCTTKDIDFFNDYLDQQSVETIKLMCGDDDEESTKCKTLLSEIPKHNTKWLSPILPFMEVFQE